METRSPTSSDRCSPAGTTCGCKNCPRAARPSFLAVHFGAEREPCPTSTTPASTGFTEGTGVVADADGVHVVRADVAQQLLAWHWHGAAPGSAATHVTFEAPGDFDLDVDRRDWDDTYPPGLRAIRSTAAKSHPVSHDRQSQRPFCPPAVAHAGPLEPPPSLAPMVFW